MVYTEWGESEELEHGEEQSKDYIEFDLLSLQPTAGEVWWTKTTLFGLIL